MRDDDYHTFLSEEREPRVQIFVIPEMVGSIIGRGGMHVKHIRSASGGIARVAPLRDSDNGREQVVMIFGNSE